MTPRSKRGGIWSNGVAITPRAPFRRSTFGRKCRKTRETVGMSEGFRFYALRHTGHTPSTRSGATLKDTMVRAGLDA